MEFIISSSCGKSVPILIDPEKSCREAINMFKLKIGSNEDFRFIFNNRDLSPYLKIGQSGLSNGSKILVITCNNFSSFKIKGNPIIISFKIRTNE